MKKIFPGFACCVLNLMLALTCQAVLTGCSKTSHGPAPNPPVDTTNHQPPPPPPDTTVSPQPSSTIFGNGVNLQPSYYNGGTVNFAWDLMVQNSKIKTVRIEIEPAMNIATVQSWISAATANGLSIIATYHKYTVLGSDDAGELLAASNWWKNNYAALHQSGSFIINLMNEWGSHSISSNAYASAYNDAIAILRTVYSGPVIIDCPGWGQGTTTALAAIKGSNGTKINDSSIILSAHVYPNGWNQAKNHSLQQSDLEELASSGRPCIIGEFGNAPSGSVDWSGLVAYAKSKGWAVVGWCWNGDGGTMNMMSPAWSTNATATSFTKSSYFDIIYNLL
jgi:mannan endo-1,4-beta-mannosidase